jgi:hypothetical protein
MMTLASCFRILSKAQGFAIYIGPDWATALATPLNFGNSLTLGLYPTQKIMIGLFGNKVSPDYWPQDMVED